MVTNLIKLTKEIFFALFLVITPYFAYAQQTVVVPTNTNAKKILEWQNLGSESDLGKKNLVQSRDMALQLAELYVKNFYGEESANLQKI